MAIALAFAGAPEMLFLDEPTAGLDVDARRTVWDELRAYAAAGRTVVLTTHHLEEAEALASRVTILRGGRAVATGTVAELRAGARLTRVRLRAAGLSPPTLAQAEANGASTTYFVADAERAVQWLVARGVPLEGLEVAPATLEDAFLAVTEEDA